MKTHSKNKRKPKANSKPPSAKPQAKIIHELASHFEADLKTALPIAIQPNGNIVYKNIVIRQNKHKNWAMHHVGNTDAIEQFYLKTCAIMAAKAYTNTNLNKFFEIKQLDTQYWANYMKTTVAQQGIKVTSDYEKYLILLTKLEHHQELANNYKEKISRMFKWSFV
jgi:hypothetical protein